MGAKGATPCCIPAECRTARGHTPSRRAASARTASGAESANGRASHEGIPPHARSRRATPGRSRRCSWWYQCAVAAGSRTRESTYAADRRRPAGPHAWSLRPAWARRPPATPGRAITPCLAAGASRLKSSARRTRRAVRTARRRTGHGADPHRTENRCPCGGLPLGLRPVAAPRTAEGPLARPPGTTRCTARLRGRRAGAAQALTSRSSGAPCPCRHRGRRATA